MRALPILFLGALLAPAQPPLEIRAIATAAYHVSDLAKAKEFYSGVLGYDEVFVTTYPSGVRAATYKVNDDQFIDLFADLKPGQDDRFSHVAFVVADIEATRRALAARGLNPSPVAKGPRGNFATTVRDPDGHLLEFVQYLPGSKHSNSKGQGLTARRISTRLRHVGVKVADAERSLKFYRDVLGCTETWRGGPDDKTTRWINMRLPGPSGDYIELMLYDPAKPLTRGSLGSMHHICLEVDEIQKPWQILKTRGIPDEDRYRPRIGRNNRWLNNLFDADGTRTELMEPGPAKP
ncbi:MAG: VOC family protein [Bryobacter sp.]|nr:VOC family protein [Bryobacter sp.]